jgi:hypothetical protein
MAKCKVLHLRDSEISYLKHLVEQDSIKKQSDKKFKIWTKLLQAHKTRLNDVIKPAI